MTDINQVTLIGRIARESEVKYTKNGNAICNFTIAVNRSRKVNNEWKDEVSFFDCTMYGNQADKIGQYLNKGKLIAVNGYLEQQKWEQNGEKRSRIKVIANLVQLLSKNEKSSQGQFDNDIPY